MAYVGRHGIHRFFSVLQTAESCCKLNKIWLRSGFSCVPQGTVLGRRLFSLYTNDISKDIDSEIRLFAAFGAVRDIKVYANWPNFCMKLFKKLVCFSKYLDNYCRYQFCANDTLFWNISFILRSIVQDFLQKKKKKKWTLARKPTLPIFILNI